MWILSARQRSIETICNTERFVEDEQEYRRILKKDTARLDEIQQILSRFYTRLQEMKIYIGWVSCGIAGLKRRQQDAYTTATNAEIAVDRYRPGHI